MGVAYLHHFAIYTRSPDRKGSRMCDIMLSCVYNNSSGTAMIRSQGWAASRRVGFVFQPSATYYCTRRWGLGDSAVLGLSG